MKENRASASLRGGLPAGLVLAAALLAASAAWGADQLRAGPGSDAAAAGAPVIAEVLRMLDGGVSNEVIATWLDSTGRRPGSISSASMVRLKQAGASEQLMLRLLELSSGRPATEVDDRPSKPVSASPDGADADTIGVGPATIQASVRYRPTWEEDEERWDLYVYMDGGQVLGWLDGHKLRLTGASRLQLSRKIAPGRHVVRLLQERHEPTGKHGTGWRHQARVCPEPIGFEVPAGGNLKLDLDWSERMPLFTGNRAPLTWSLSEGGRQLDGARDVGTESDEWAPLCEELKTRQPRDGGAPPRWLRRELERCVRWDELWPGWDGPVESRARVRSVLESYDFRPVPAVP